MSMGFFRRLEWFSYIRCDISLSVLTDSSGCDLFCTCVHPNSLCIVR